MRKIWQAKKACRGAKQFTESILAGADLGFTRNGDDHALLKI